jgi:hypothetical protein
LVEICIRLAKLKSENKEILTYLLYDATDPLHYAEKVKTEIGLLFDEMNTHYYYAAKTLRKINRIISKYKRFTSHKQGEIELLLYFAQRYFEKIDLTTNYKPLQGLLHRALSKSHSLILKLHEDLLYDYSNVYNGLVQNVNKKMKHWDKEKYVLHVI